MGNQNSSPDHGHLRRGLSVGSFDADSIAVGGEGPTVSRTWRLGDSLADLPPGSIHSTSIKNQMRPIPRTIERQNSLEKVCAPGATSMLNSEAYSCTRLLHEPRLRLNSTADASSVSFRERRNSILVHNQKHLKFVMDMDDDDVEMLGRKASIFRSMSPKFSPVTATGRKRRNSSNSIFLDQTADNILDQKALVKCVSAAFHGAIEDAPGRVTKAYHIFIDPDNKYFCRPSFREVYRFVNNIFLKAQLEAEVLIISLVYFERLLMVMESQLVIGYRNWRAIVLACCVLASKVWDDLSMINADFSCIMAKQFTLKQINKLEVAMLSALKFDVKVSLSMYVLYYFKLRSMLGPGSLFHDGTKPLSMRDAHKLHALSSSYQKRITISDAGRRRTSTIGTNEGERARQVSTAALEHMVRYSPKKEPENDDSSPAGYRLQCGSKARRNSIDAPKKTPRERTRSDSDSHSDSNSHSPNSSDSEKVRPRPLSVDDHSPDCHVVVAENGMHSASISPTHAAADVKPRLRRQRRGRVRRPELVEETNDLHQTERQHIEL